MQKADKNTLKICQDMVYYSLHGLLAQLGACHTGSVEVTGSSPV